jgi:hypothetical protein
MCQTDSGHRDTDHALYGGNTSSEGSEQNLTSLAFHFDALIILSAADLRSRLTTRHRCVKSE